MSDDMGAFAVLADTLSELGDSEYKWIVGTTLKNVTVVTPGKKNTTLKDMDVISEHFAGRYNDLYAVLIQVWKEEKLSPFAVAPKTETAETSGS
jgi:NifB/MoaA-like Fe-S oxidoreductase